MALPLLNEIANLIILDRNTVLNKEIDALKEKIATLKVALDNAASSCVLKTTG